MKKLEFVPVDEQEKNKKQEIIALADQAKVLFLSGKIDVAEAKFLQAEKLQRNFDPAIPYLHKFEGIKHADSLWRSGNTEYARRVTEKNLEICEQKGMQDYISWCHRVLGDLDAAAGQNECARTHYHEALKIARNTGCRELLLEILISRGRWAAQHFHDIPAALNDLQEALSYAKNSGYRIYEADTRVALAWTHLAEALPAHISPKTRNNAFAHAWQEADRAHRMSKNMDYYWGRADAEKVMERLVEMEENYRNLE